MNKSSATLMFYLFLFVFFGWMAVEARRFQETASYFPLSIASVASILVIVAAVKQIVSIRKGEKSEPFHEKFHFVLKYMLWVIGYVILIYLVGFILASVIYVSLFLFLEAKISFLKIICVTATMVVFIIVISHWLELTWPSNVLGLF
jgi:hypothetical protein